MIEGLGMLNLGSLTSGLGFFLKALVIGLVIFMFFIPLMFVFWITGFKHQITIRKLTGGKIVIKRDKAKIVKDKQGVEKLKLLSTPKMFKSDRIGMPPDEAVLTTDKGKMYMDIYRTQNGQYFWAVDTGIQEKIIKLPKGAKEDNFEPMNTMDRSFYADEWEEAEKHKKKSFGEILTVAAPWVIIFLIVAIFIFNWDAIAAPALESQKTAHKMQEMNLEYHKELQKTTALLMQVQVLEDKYRDTTEEEDEKG